MTAIIHFRSVDRRRLATTAGVSLIHVVLVLGVALAPRDAPIDSLPQPVIDVLMMRAPRVAPPLRCQPGRNMVKRTLAIFENNAVEETQMADALRLPIGGSGDEDTAEAVADENDVVDLFEDQQVDDVGNHRIQPALRGHQVEALTGAGAGGGEHPVALLAQPVGDATPAPATMKSAVDKHIRSRIR